VSLFAPEDISDAEPIPEDEERILEKVAERVVRWKMSVPAIIFLESVKPLNYIGSQTMVFFEPIIQSVFNFKEYDTFQRAMERRENVERLLQMIEAADAVDAAWDREYRRRLKKARNESKSWWVKLRLTNPVFELPPREDIPDKPEEKST